jgi:DNA-binding response OmpR family regulator
MVFLLTDDSRPTRNLIKNYLSELNVGSQLYFVEAENGEMAYDTVKKQRVDFILLDWNLGTTMTGLDVLKEIRKLDQYKDVPVMMVTSESDKVHVIEALKCGANDFIAKPIAKKPFIEKVLRLIVGLK